MTDLAREADMPMALFHLAFVRNVAHIRICPSRSSFTCCQELCNHPREQADKPDVVPSQHPVYVVEDCRDARQECERS